MALRPFSFPLAEARFLRAGGLVYTFRVRGGGSLRYEVMEEHYINQELEDIIRAALGNLDQLQPFSSTHFNVFPYKTAWERLSKMAFKHGAEKLSCYPHVITLYLESSKRSGNRAAGSRTPIKASLLPSGPEPLPKRIKTESPLEEAILQELLDAEARIPCHVSRYPVRQQEELPAGTKEAHGEPCKGCQQMTTTHVHSGAEETEEEQENGANVFEDLHSDPSTPVRPGVLTQLARRIFPFSIFFKAN